jgi:hypothetical protein
LVAQTFKVPGWTKALREEHRLRVFENRVLRRIFGPKRDEVTGGWRKLHNEELHSLYSSPSIIRMIKSRSMRWAGHVARTRKKRNAYRILVGKPGGKRPLADVGGWTVCIRNVLRRAISTDPLAFPLPPNIEIIHKFQGAVACFLYILPDLYCDMGAPSQNKRPLLGNGTINTLLL